MMRRWLWLWVGAAVAVLCLFFADDATAQARSKARQARPSAPARRARPTPPRRRGKARRPTRQRRRARSRRARRARRRQGQRLRIDPRKQPELYAPRGVHRRGAARIFMPGEKRRRTVRFDIVGRRAVYEGDIMLGDVRKLRRKYAKPKPGKARRGGKSTVNAAVLADDSYLWPGGVIPYSIKRGMPASKRREIQEAVRRMNKTALKLRPKRWNDKDHVEFFYNGNKGCYSYLGRQGGMQPIAIAQWCRTGSIQHEILHAAGFFHEQSRNDRDKYVKVVWDKIAPSMRHNFGKSGSRGRDLGEYNYASIMHYGPRGFSVDGSKTLVPLEKGVRIGQREKLSAGDLAAIQELYGETVPSEMKLSCNPAGENEYEIFGSFKVPGNHPAHQRKSRARVRIEAGSRGTIRADRFAFSSGKYRLATITQRGDLAVAPRVKLMVRPDGEMSPLVDTVQCVPPGGPNARKEPGSFMGEYASNHGKVRCRERRTRVECVYRQRRRSGLVRGTLDCRASRKLKLTCSWKEPDRRGKAKFVRYQGGKLVGTWGSGWKSSGGGEWTMQPTPVKYPSRPSWQTASDPEDLPLGAVVVSSGYRGDTYLCRAKVGGRQLPGAVKRGKCEVTYAGKKQKLERFQILVANPKRSEFSQVDGSIPGQAVAADQVPTRPLVLCRGKNGGQTLVGRVHDGRCLVSSWGGGKYLKRFEVLTAR